MVSGRNRLHKGNVAGCLAIRHLYKFTPIIIQQSIAVFILSILQFITIQCIVFEPTNNIININIEKGMLNGSFTAMNYSSIDYNIA